MGQIYTKSSIDQNIVFFDTLISQGVDSCQRLNQRLVNNQKITQR